MSDENFQPAVESQEIDEPVAQTKNSPNEIAKLHRECAKYRNALKTANDQNSDFQKQLGDAKSELETAVKQSLKQDVLNKLDKFGCLKSSLVFNDIPEDCQNLDDFISDYQKNYPFLFKQQKLKHGFSFKSGGRVVNYSPSQQMNSYIRSALGR